MVREIEQSYKSPHSYDSGADIPRIVVMQPYLYTEVRSEYI